MTDFPLLSSESWRAHMQDNTTALLKPEPPPSSEWGQPRMFHLVSRLGMDLSSRVAEDYVALVAPVARVAAFGLLVFSEFGIPQDQLSKINLRRSTFESSTFESSTFEYQLLPSCISFDLCFCVVEVRQLAAICGRRQTDQKSSPKTCHRLSLCKVLHIS